MSLSTPKPDLNEQIYQQACEWLVAFRTGVPDGTARERLDTWLRKSPEHVRAYLEVSAIWENAALHDPQHSVSAEQHVARALADDSNVVQLDPLAFAADANRLESVTVSGPVAASRHRFRRASYVIAASALLGCTALGWWYTHLDTYETGVGEQTSLTLADGSLIELNARSRIRVQLSKGERDVDVLEGQALFHVAKDPRRPFIVTAAGTRVRAVGTQFDVYRKHKGTRVTVIEGTVAVIPVDGDFRETEPVRYPGADATLPPSTSSSAPSPPKAAKSNVRAGAHSRSASHSAAAGHGILLSAGEQVTVLPNATLQPTPVDTVAATAWTQRRLMFDSAPLSEVVEEFNRYNMRQMIIEDPRLEDLAVIGVFSYTDPSSLLRFLAGQPGVSIIEDESRILITRK